MKNNINYNGRFENDNGCKNATIIADESALSGCKPIGQQTLRKKKEGAFNMKHLKMLAILCMLVCSLFTFIGGDAIEEGIGGLGIAEAAEQYTITYDTNGGGTFSDGSTQNVVVYEGVPRKETRISKTSNVSDDGSSFSGNYPAASNGVTDVITIDGATELKVTVTYQTSDTSYGWVCIYDESVTPSTSNYASSISGKLGGSTKTTKTFTVKGDTVQIFWRDSSSRNYYGYYAVVEATFETINFGDYKDARPTNPATRFRGWYTDSDCSDGNEFNIYDGSLSFDMIVYAKYEEVAETYSGTCGTCSWIIYGDGLLRIYPTDGIFGTLASNTFLSQNFWPWYSYRTSVIKVVVDEGVLANANASFMFYDMQNCTEMDLVSLDTYSVTNMRNMFSNAGRNASTFSLNLSGWDTSNITDMQYMFSYAGHKSTSWSLGDLSGWDTSSVTNMMNMFNYAGYSASTFSLDLSDWDTSSVTSMYDMFSFAGSNARTWSIGDLSSWDTSNVTTMYQMFYQAGYFASIWSLGDLSGWDTSSVANMQSMFNYAGYSASTFSLDLSDWDTSNVKDMSKMFYYAGYFASTFSLDLSGWNTSNVTSMNSMFSNAGYSASTWSVGDLSGWNTSKVTNMEKTFHMSGYSASIWSVGDLSGWDTSNVINMSAMFQEAGYSASVFSLNLSNWDTSKVRNMSFMFTNAGYSTSTWSVGDLSDWDTSSVTNMQSMFNKAGHSASTWSIGDLSDWDTSKVTNMSSMFNNAGYSASTWSIGDLSRWDTSNVTSMYGMFQEAGSSAGTFILDLSGWDTSKVTSMTEMFRSTGRNVSTFSLNLSGWDTSKVTNMQYMFQDAGFFANTFSIEGLSRWDTSSVSSMNYMFSETGCYASIFSLDLSDWDTSKVRNMEHMFYKAGYKASSWSVGDLSGWNTSSVTNMRNMFSYVGQNTSTFSLNLSGWDTSNVTTMVSMFNNTGRNTSAFSLDLSGWDTSSVADMQRMFYQSGLTKIIFGDKFTFIGTTNSFSTTGNNWVKARNADGRKTYDYTQYKGSQVAALNNTNSTPLLGGTWIKNYTGDEYVTNPDGSVEYISENAYWDTSKDNVWTYSFSVFDDSLLFYLYEEIIDGYSSEAMNPYYIIIKNNMATITNTKNKNVSNLMISKTVEGIETNDDFEFTITLNGDNISGKQIFSSIIFNDGVGKILLKHGESKMFELPVGTTFDVKETVSLNYSSEINNASGTIVKGETATVNAVNTYIEEPVIEPEEGTVNITVKKTTENYTGNEKFRINGSFEGLNTNTNYMLSNGKTFMSDNNGNGFCSIELSDGENVVIYNIPENAKYQFTENAGDYISSYIVVNNGNGGDNTIIKKNWENVDKNKTLSTAKEVSDAGEEIVITFHNKFETVQNLTISKVVQNEQADGTFVNDVNCNEAFEFTINFKAMDENTVFRSTVGKVVADEDGEASKTFYLKHGQRAEFYDVPAGIQYEVIESKSIYTPSYIIEGTIVANASASANKGSSLKTAIETVEINENSVVTFTNRNLLARDKAIHLKKRIDAQGNEDILRALEHNSMYRLEGAEYQIIIDGEVVETLVTDSNGEATSTQVFADGTTGFIKEITPPDGFLLDETEHQFTVDTSDSETYCEVRVFDVPTFDPTVFRFKKTAAGTGVAQGNTTFEGAVFKYEYFDNTDWSGTPTRTWYFETDDNGLHRYHTDYLADGYTSDELYTDTTGIYTFPLGSVKITEVVSPLGYKELPVMYSTITQPAMGADAKWQFTPETSAFLRTSSNGMYEGDEPIDETKLGSLIVEKIDRIYLSDVSDITFAGCEFTIYNMSTNPVKIGDNPIANNGEACMTIVVGEDGKATTGAVLPIGTYVVKETKGNEYYECNTDFSYEFTIHGNEENEIIEVSCFNQIKAPISFIKTDENGNPLAGAKLQIKDAEGNVVDEWTSTTEAHIVRLAGGTYTLHEKMPPLSYWWAEDFEFIVHTSDIGFVQLVDNDGTPVVGAEVELKLGETVRKTVITDSQGRFTMNKFDRIGGYTVHMVDIPDGYNFGGNNDFRFRMYSTDTDSLETESDNLIILDYVPIEEGDNGENPSSTVDVDEMSVTMVDKKFVHMVSSGGTGTIITVIIAAVLGCTTGILVYLGKKKSRENKNKNKTE